MKQPEFAELLGLGTTRYGNYEAGKREPDLRVLTKIQSVTHCDLNWLITGKVRNEIAPPPPESKKVAALQPVGFHQVSVKRSQKSA